MSNLTNMLEPLRAWWDEATAPTRAAAIGLSLLVLAGLAFAATLAASPDYTPIFHGVSGKDASAVEEELRGKNIPMQFDDKTGTVSVPSKDESEATMTVAAAGVLGKDKDSAATPQGISSSPFTDPTQQQAQTLANNEARLSQILNGLGPVGSSNVIIAPGNSTELFGDNVPPTASITLNLRQGETLSDDQIAGIVNLVVMSYTGLTAKSVSIDDQTGAALWDPKSGATSLGNDKGARADSEAADTIRKKLQDALAVFGPQNTRVVVTAELDRDETHIHQTQSTPGPAISQHTKTETLAGGGVAPVGGATGVAGNTGPTSYGGGGSGGSGGDYKSKDETINSALNTTDTTITKGEGGVKTMSATVLVNSTVPATVLPAIQQAVATTIGARPGDQSRIYTVQQVPFDTTAQKAQLDSMKSLASQQMWANISKVLAVSVAGCVLLFILTRSGRRAAEPQLALAGGGANIGLLEGASDRELDSILEERPLSIEDVLAEMPDVEDTPRSRRRRMHAPSIEEQQDLKLESIQDMIGSHPESVALLMKGWMVE